MKLTPDQIGHVFRIVAYVMVLKKLDPNEPLPEPAPNARKSTFRSLKGALRELYVLGGPADRERRIIDQRLNKLGLPNLYALEPIWSNVHVRILKRGAIRNEEELQYVESLLDDRISDLSEKDLGVLANLTNVYVKKKQSSQP